MEPRLSQKQFLTKLRNWLHDFELASAREQADTTQTETDWWDDFAANCGHPRTLFTTGRPQC